MNVRMLIVHVTTEGHTPKEGRQTDASQDYACVDQAALREFCDSFMAIVMQKAEPVR